MHHVSHPPSRSDTSLRVVLLPCVLCLPCPLTLAAVPQTTAALQPLVTCAFCSAFLFFVMRRLLDIQGQLYTMRALAKEAAAAQQQLLDNGSAGSDNGKLSGGAAGGDSTLQQRQRQRQLTHTLSRMARSSQDGEAAKQD